MDTHTHGSDGTAASGVLPPPNPDPVPREVAFAGRVGGNLAFTDRNAVYRTPDAAKLHNLAQAIDIRGFSRTIYMKAAAIECVGTFLQTFLAGMFDAAFAGFAASGSSPLALNLAHALTVNFMITLFIFAAGPPSGGHMNPFITLATFFAGLSTLPRTVYYVFAQLLGAVAGAFFLKLGLGGSALLYPDGVVGGCTFNFSLISYGQAFVLEFTCYMIMAFLAFGVGLDPRQGKVLGPAFSPVLVGFVVALVTFGTGLVRPGWSGFSANPARCFGLMAAREQLTTSWINWVAALTASVVHGLIYTYLPPNMNEM